MAYSASMRLSIRLDNLADRTPDLAAIDRLWRLSIEERSTEEQLRTLTMPSASDFPTSRFFLVQDEAGAYVAMAGSVLPGPDARFSIEKSVGLPHPALPSSDRTQLGEGLGLYVLPDWRRFGLARALTCLSMLLAWSAGAVYIVAENGAVSLNMAVGAGFTNTGVVTRHLVQGPYYLMVGRADQVLVTSWRASREAIEACTLSPEVRAVVDRWIAYRP